MGNQNERPVVFKKGEKLYLRPLHEADLALLASWANDEEISQFFSRGHPTTLIQEKRWLEKRLADEGNDLWVGITLSATHELIGMASLHRVSLIHGTAWLGITIGEKGCWGKGYGTEAVGLLLEVAFNRLNLRKVCWAALANNDASIRCAQKCGFKLEGKKKAQFKRGNQLIDEINLAMFCEDWLLTT